MCDPFKDTPQFNCMLSIKVGFPQIWVTLISRRYRHTWIVLSLHPCILKIIAYDKREDTFRDNS